MYVGVLEFSVLTEISTWLATVKFLAPRTKFKRVSGGSSGAQKEAPTLKLTAGSLYLTTTDVLEGKNKPLKRGAIHFYVRGQLPGGGWRIRKQGIAVALSPENGHKKGTVSLCRTLCRKKVRLPLTKWSVFLAFEHRPSLR